jgi:hypothetical protein
MAAASSKRKRHGPVEITLTLLDDFYQYKADDYEL